MVGEAITRRGRLGPEAFARSPAALIVNAKARSGEKVAAKIQSLLERAGLHFDTVKLVRRPATLPQAVRGAIASGVKFLVIGGGDGTVSCAAGQLIDTDVTLGILPLGTGNDFARGLGIPFSLRGAVQVLAEGRVARVDVGFVDDKPFLNAASVGLSTVLTQKLSAKAKKALGKAAYPVAATRAVKDFTPFQLTLGAGRRSERLNAFQLVVGNGPFHGAGSRVAPGSTLDDGALDVYAIVESEREDGKKVGPARTLAMLARIGASLGRGTHVEHPNVRHFKTRKVRVVTQPPLEVDVDGELYGQTPVTFSVAPAALSVVVPASPSRGRARS